MKKKESIVIIFLLLTGLVGIGGEDNSVVDQRPTTADRCYSVCKHEVMPATKQTGIEARGGEMITSTIFFF